MRSHVNTVSQKWDELTAILQKMKSQLEELADWENKKSKAILERDRDFLDHCSREQETRSHDLQTLEKVMFSLCEELALEYQQPLPRSLGAMLLWSNLPETMEDILDRDAAQLQMLLSALHMQTENNQKLLTDSVNFFQTMIEALSGEEKLGYNSTGEEKSSRNRPHLLVDLNC